MRAATAGRLRLYGGALADAVDRRRMVLGCEAAMGLLSVLLLANSLLPHPMLWPLYLVAALLAGLDGLQRPSLEALVPRIVPADQIPAAFALSALRWHAGAIAGPAAAGVLVAAAGLAAGYAADVVTYLVSLALLSRLRAAPPLQPAGRPSVAGILAGLRYASGRPVLVGTYLVDLAAMLLAMPIALYPFMADRLVLDDRDAPWVLGLLYAAGSVGALAATLTSGWVSRVHRHGLAVVWSAAGWGLAIACFGLARNVWLAVALLAAAGAADMVSGLFRTTIWNQTIPDELRGRLAGIELLSYSAGPSLGQLRAGAVAALAGVRGSVVSGGLLCMVTVGTLAALLPRFVRYDARTDEHAARERRRRGARDTQV